jgi:Putative Ig domain
VQNGKAAQSSSPRQRSYNVVTMSRQLAQRAMLAVSLVLGATAGLWAQAPLTMTTTSLPSMTTGSNVRMRIAVSGGSQPFNWKLTGGKLPPGLKLNPTRGVIGGTPTVPGAYDFEITVTDSGVPAMQIEREFRIVVTGALGIDWKQHPAVHGQALDGSVVVSNFTKQDFTLTVIVMCVNEIGRATALGYQEFTLRSGAQQVIPFGSSPGPGTYIVHADAVAEVASTNTIYRARKQTASPLAIESPE